MNYESNIGEQITDEINTSPDGAASLRLPSEQTERGKVDWLDGEDISNDFSTRQMIETPTASPEINAYRETASHISSEHLLGRLVVFTISDKDVNLEQARDSLTTHGLQLNTIRERLRNVDAFKKAAKEVETKFRFDSGVQHALLVRNVGRDDTATARRHIVMERAVSEKGKRRHLVYGEIAELVYDRGLRQKDGTVKDDQITVIMRNFEKITGYSYSPEEQAWLDSHLGEEGAKLVEKFEYYKDHMDHNAVRGVVRDYIIKNMRGISVKENGGGIYFVQEKHAGELENLAKFVRDMGSYMHTIPLINIMDQRNMLVDAYNSDLSDRVFSLNNFIKNITEDGNRKISQKTYDDIQEQVAELMAQAQEYSDLLGDKLDSANLSLRGCQSAALSLLTRVRITKKMTKS